MSDAIRYITVVHDGHTFIVMDIKDFTQLQTAAGYAFHDQSLTSTSIEEACKTLGAEVDGYRGRTQ